MKKIYRFISLILSLCMISLLLFSCAPKQKPESGGDKISVVTTIFPPYDFARQIAGDKADITMLLPPGSESHSFEPSPKDIVNIQECDIFIYGGGKSDEWVRTILDSMDVSNMQIISMMDVSNALHEETVEGMQGEHGQEEDDEYDEHVWTSPKNAALISKSICDALIEVDGANSQYYTTACDQYVGKLDALDKRFSDIVSGSKRKTVVFGDRFPFLYFAKQYGLSYWAAFPGCSSETEASAATIAFLTDKVKNEGIPVVFYLEFSNQKIADILCESTGAKKLIFHSCHTVSKDDLQAGVTYLDLMDQNADNLEEALN